jgi:hypothetical protein
LFLLFITHMYFMYSMLLIKHLLNVLITFDKNLPKTTKSQQPLLGTIWKWPQGPARDAGNLMFACLFVINNSIKVRRSSLNDRWSSIEFNGVLCKQQRFHVCTFVYLNGVNTNMWTKKIIIRSQNINTKT